jgi:hypothetical protein
VFHPGKLAVRRQRDKPQSRIHFPTPVGSVLELSSRGNNHPVAPQPKQGLRSGRISVAWVCCFWKRA